MSKRTTRDLDLKPHTLPTNLLSSASDLKVKSWMYRDRAGSADVLVDLSRNGVHLATVSVRVPYPKGKR